MTTLEQIQEKIIFLPPNDKMKLFKWFADLDDQIWDKQIEKETLAIAQMETEQSEAAERLFELPPDGRQCLTDLIEGNKQLTREIAVTFIRGIKVYNDKRIEIEWNFADELVKYVEQVQKICS